MAEKGKKPRKKLTEEERKAAKRARDRAYYQRNKDKINERRRKRRADKLKDGRAQWGPAWHPDLAKYWNIDLIQYYHGYNQRAFWQAIEYEMLNGVSRAAIIETLEAQLTASDDYINHGDATKGNENWFKRGSHLKPDTKEFYFYHSWLGGV